MKNLEESETIQNGWGLYIALTIILLMWFGFSGCEYNFAPQGDFVIRKIDTRANSTLYCNYFIKDEDFVFVDSCGKWNIGDTITIKW